LKGYLRHFVLARGYLSFQNLFYHYNPYSIFSASFISQFLFLALQHFFFPLLFTSPSEARNNPHRHPVFLVELLGTRALSSGKMNAVIHSERQWISRRRENEREGGGDTREIKLTILPRRAKDYCVISIEMIAVSISGGEIVHSDHSERSLLLLLSKMPSAEVT
jgi:hypothetical protein